MGRLTKSVTIYGLGNKKRSIRALLDSGADKSVMDIKIAKSLGLDKYPYENRQYRGVDNKIHLGKVVFTEVALDGRMFASGFFLLKHKGVLIGNDLLQHSSINLDFKKNTAKVRKGERIRILNI